MSEPRCTGCITLEDDDGTLIPAIVQGCPVHDRESSDDGQPTESEGSRMTDRHSGYVVTLEDSVREDDAEGIISALRHVKGVLSVEPVIAEPSMQIAETRARTDEGLRLLRIATALIKGEKPAWDAQGDADA